MRKYSILWKKSAVKDLEDVPKIYYSKILETINQLSDNPFPDGCKKLISLEKTYRIRIANYRIIYQIENEVLVIEIIKIAHRKDVYK